MLKSKGSVQPSGGFLDHHFSDILISSYQTFDVFRLFDASISKISISLYVTGAFGLCIFKNGSEIPEGGITKIEVQNLDKNNH